MPGAGVGSGGGTNIKECIQQWIRKQSEQFIERWCGPDIDQNPALEVVKRLAEVATQLDVSSPLCGSALRVSVHAYVHSWLGLHHPCLALKNPLYKTGF